MDAENLSEKKQWYAIRVTYNRELKVKEDLDAKHIENFIPMQYKQVIKGDRMVKRLVPSIHNLIFMYIDAKRMAEYKANTTLPIRYIMNKETNKPIVIPPQQMQNFIAVAGSYDEQLIYLDGNVNTLQEGDKVKVIGGIFEGAIGTLKRIKGCRRIVVSIPGLIAVASANIHPSLIEKITD